MARPHPETCQHCAYDRRFPGFETGGWIDTGNNGPIVPCPVCNDEGSWPFDPAAWCRDEDFSAWSAARVPVPMEPPGPQGADVPGDGPGHDEQLPG